MLNEYALRFYTFLEVSIRQDAGEWLEAASAASTPYMDAGERTKLMDSYQYNSRDIIEEIRESFNQEDKTEELRNNF